MTSGEAMTEVLPQWVIEELREWFLAKKTGSFTVHAVAGEAMKTEETAFKKKPLDNTS